MANSATHAALPYPIKGARYTVPAVYLDADGDPTDPTTPDTEISKDNGAFADCAEEVTTATGSNGAGMLTLTGAETDCSLVVLAFKVASGPKATLMTLAPAVLAEVGTGTLSAGSAGGGTLGTLLAYDVTGCFIKTTGGTGGGGTGGASNQARKIVTYNTSSGAFTVTPNWETTPDNTTTYAVLLPEGVTLGMLKALNPTTAGRTLDVSSGGEAGLDWANVGSPTTVVNLSGTTVATVTTTTTATNVTTVNGLAANVITAAATAADFGAEVADAVWDEARAGHVTAGTFGEYAPANVTHWQGTAVATPFTPGVPSVDVFNVYGSEAAASQLYTLMVQHAGGTVTMNLTGNLSGTVGSVTGAVGSVTGMVGGIAGTITTLDALDTAQDTQHATTQAAVAAVQADLPQRITKNTALSGFMFFMVSSSDHVTGATGLTVTATRSLDGAAFGACANAVSEVSNGWYKIDLAAADLNANVVALKFTATGADARMVTIITQPT